MKINEIFRHLLDFIDSVEHAEPENTEPEYANEPETTTIPTATILATGTDANRPKNPADIRADSISMYPNHQHKGNE